MARSITRSPTARRSRACCAELITPNGVGLSPDGKTVYYAETFTGRLWSLPLTKPGKADRVAGFTPGVFVGAFPGIAYFDSLGVQADGGVCCATILAGGITTFGPKPGKVKHTPHPRSAGDQYLLGRQGDEDGLHHGIRNG